MKSCVRCGEQVPPERVSFLLSEGRPVICVGCQEELEMIGEYETYVAEYSCIEKEGEGYAFEPVKVRAAGVKPERPILTVSEEIEGVEEKLEEAIEDDREFI